MDSLTNVLTSLSPPQGGTQGVVSPLASLGNFAANDGAEPGGLFALLLGQLTVEAPAVGPMSSQSTDSFAHLRTQFGDEALPVSGKPLPLSLSTLPLEVDTLQLEVDTLPEIADLDVLAPEAEQIIVAPGVALIPVLPNTLTTVAAPVAQIKRHTATPVQTGTPTPVNTATTLPVTPLAAPLETAPIELAPLDFSVRELQPALPSTPALPTNPVSPLVTQTTPLASQLTTQAPLSLDYPVNDARWGEQLGERLIWMNENGVGRASLRMNPAELGPVEVRITVSNDDARVTFTAQNGATREALDAAMPRLREMFAAQGLNLSDASVSQQSSDDQQQTAHSDESREGTAAGPDADIMNSDFHDADITDSAIGTRGLIDTYA